MTTILVSFVVALTFSLLLTPIARKMGMIFGAMDMPSPRKVHTHPIPRTGGLAIFVSFILSLAAVSVANTDISRMLVLDRKMIFLFSGGLICFVTGFVDDFHRLPARMKLLLQILAATVAYAGGIDITRLAVGTVNIRFGMMSYGLTVFWFLLFINSVNLVDGLDGLAGGVTFFATLMMVLLAVLGGRYLIAVLFAALAGGILGFLRYNFNPASIFLGDSGSYFIGYTIAGFSILGEVKSQTGSAILIPLIALGLPVFDTVLSSMRRFMVGKKIFGADKGHIHHRMIALGLNTRRVVLVMYAISFSLCLISLSLVNVRDEKAGFVLVLVGFGAIMLTRKLGYFDYLNSNRVLSWIRDISDETGISRERRSFLNIQINISKSNTLSELWEHTIQAMKMLEFDCSLLYLYPSSQEAGQSCIQAPDNSERRKTPLISASICLREKPPERIWMRNELTMQNPENVCSHCLIRIELPLAGSGIDKPFGCLVMIKDNRLGNLSHYSLKRVEHLRRAVVASLMRIDMNDASSLLEINGPHADLIPIDRRIVIQKSRHVLVVDDEVCILMAIEEILLQHDFVVTTATDAEEALIKFHNNMISIVILDINLPGMNGLDLCGKLKKLKPGIRIIAITGMPSKFESETCRNAGFDGYLIKPLDNDILMVYMEKVVSSNK